MSRVRGEYTKISIYLKYFSFGKSSFLSAIQYANHMQISKCNHFLQGNKNEMCILCHIESREFQNVVYYQKRENSIPMSQVHTYRTEYTWILHIKD